MDTPVPGQNHPAVVQYRHGIQYARHGVFRVAVAPVLSMAEFLGPVSEPSYKTLEFTSQKAAQSLYPEYGYYVWNVWTDQHGRFLTDERAEWQENPNTVTLPVWNPPAPKAWPVKVLTPLGDVWRIQCSACGGPMGGDWPSRRRVAEERAVVHLRERHGVQTAPR